MKLKYISWLPAFIMMVIIFMFSAKPAVQSAESSLTIANSILEAYENFSNVTVQENQREISLNRIDFIVRKGAHCFEYAVLAITVAFYLWTRKKRGKQLIISSIIISSFYAATDEFHQLFVPGRSGEIKDVCIDTTGVIIGTISFILVANLYIHLKNRKKKISN